MAKTNKQLGGFIVSLLCYGVFFVFIVSTFFLPSTSFSDNIFTEQMPAFYPDLAYGISTLNATISGIDTKNLWSGGLILLSLIIVLTYLIKYNGPNHPNLTQNPPFSIHRLLHPYRLIHWFILIGLFILSPSIQVFYFITAIFIFMHACLKYMYAPQYQTSIIFSITLLLCLLISSYMIVFIPAGLIIALAFNPWQTQNHAKRGIAFIIFAPLFMGIFVLFYCYHLMGLGFMPFGHAGFDIERAILFWPDILATAFLIPLLWVWLIKPRISKNDKNNQYISGNNDTKIIALAGIVIISVSAIIAMGLGFNISTVWIAASTVHISTVHISSIHIAQTGQANKDKILINIHLAQDNA